MPGRTMVKLVALFKKAAELEDFDNHFSAIHVPLLKKSPGLRRLEVTRITGAPIGDTKFHVMAELYFDSREALDAALASQEGKAVARDILSFAAPLLTVFIGEVEG
jgi:uncharacterized protein (TIGR02118 family)